MKMTIDRRTLLKGSAGAVTFLATPMISRRAWAQDPLVVRVGGGYEDAAKLAYADPFRKETGIEVVIVLSKDNPYNEMKLSVDSGAYRWDAAGGITKELYLRLISNNLLEEHKIDSVKLDSRPVDSYNAHWIAHSLYCYGLVYRETSFENPLKSFVDMWDVTKFPGRRALRSRVVDAIEMAARGGGISPDDVYEVLSTDEGWERVYKALDEIRPHINIWWEADEQIGQVIGSGDLDIFPITGHRAQKMINDGAPLAIVYNQAYYTTQGWCIPKGSPKADIAREFIEFCIDPEREAAFANEVLMGPLHPRSFDFIDKAVGERMPTYPENFRQMREQNTAFWVENIDTATERFQEWLLKG